MSGNDGPQLRRPIPKRDERGTRGMSRWHGNVRHEAAASRHRRHLRDESVIQVSGDNLTTQRKVQGPLHLSAQLLCLLLYAATSVSSPMLGLLQGSGKLRIIQMRLNVSLMRAF
jgi:hypothetical protein